MEKNAMDRFEHVHFRIVVVENVKTAVHALNVMKCLTRK